jgi:hypothetical protein
VCARSEALASILDYSAFKLRAAGEPLGGMLLGAAACR